MSRNRIKSRRTSRRTLPVMLALACAWPLLARGDWGDTCYWKSGSANGNWDNTFWYNTTRSWDNHNPGYVGGQDLRFDNASNLDMTNNWSGQGTNMWRITFISGTGARTIYGSTQNTFRNNGTPKIENQDADAQVLHFPFRLETKLEINPVSGNLTTHGAIDNNGQWIDVWGDNAKYLYVNGVLSGSGGIAVKQNSTLVLTNNQAFSGGLWVEKGTVQLGNHTNAMGAGTVSVGTNATLDLQHGTVSLRPVALNLYNGRVTKAAGDTITYRGALTSYNSSTVSVTDSTLYFAGDFAISGGTLTFTNSVEAGMASGSSMTGSGAFAKDGSGVFRLYPGTHSGNISLNQGEIRQYTGTMTGSGTLTMAGGTKYSSDGATERTLTKALVVNGNVGLAVNSTGGLVVTNTVDLGNGLRIVTNNNPVTFAGVMSNGGLAKAGAGTMVLSGANTYALGTLVSAGVLEGTTTSLQGNITNNAALTFNQAGNGTYAGALSGSGALTNAGAGTVTLSGASTMSGPTTVAAGTLLVSGSLGSSAVTVNGGATLAGAGTVGALTANGIVSPGNSTNASADLKSAALTLGDGGSCRFDLANAAGTPGTDWDKISGSGTLTVNAAGTFTIHVNGAAAGFSSSASYAWPILSGTSVSGFNAARFAVNTNNFTAPTAGGTFSVAQSATNVVLTFTPSAPVPPTGLAASDGTSPAHAALSWNNVDGETGFVVWRHTANVFGSATAIQTNAADALTYNDAGASAGQLYYYWVTATNATGSSAESASDSGYKRLAAPGSVAATDGGSTANVAVTWDAVTGASTYHVYRDTDATPAGATALGPQASGFTDAATAGQLYYYWVVASNSTSSSTGDWSTADAGYVKLTAPGGVAATENQSDRATVTWGNVAGETGFGIWRHTADVSGSATCIGSVAADVLTYDDTTGDAGTTYYYWVRATNSTSASQSDFSASDSGMKTLSEPTTAASAIVFGDLDTTSYTVSWTRGNGDYVLVVAKQGGAPTDPSDSTAYAADAAFGSGDTTAAGSYVVYKGAGTNVAVTALSAGTEYTFAVYEFNGATTPNYRTSDEPVSSRYTLVAGPNTQASAITVAGTNEVTLAGINWTDGNGASRLVVVKAGSAVDGFPVDGANYVASTNFGGGTQIGAGNYVVWAGSGPIGAITNLIRDAAYHFRVFEFNGTLGTTANFLTNAAAGNPYSLKTMAIVPGSNPTDLTLSAIGTNGLTVTWTKGTTGTNTLIVIRAGGNPVDPSDLNSYTADAAFGSGSNLGSGSYVVYNGTGSSVTVTNLVPGASYTVEATSFNGSGGSENYRGTPTSATGSTLMPEPSQASAMAFGTLGSASYAVSFTAGNGLSRLVVAKQGSAVDWTPTDGTAYAGENNAFGSGTELSAGNFLVHRGTSPFTLSGLTAATDYHIRIFEYQGTNATLNYTAAAATGNPSNRYALSVEPTVHGTLSATAVSDSEVDLDWGDATGESGFVILRRSGAAPTGVPADGSAYSAGNAIGDGTVVYAGTAAGAGSMTDSSLTADTTYYYVIFPYAYDGTAAHATYNYSTGGTPGSASATTGKSEPGASSSVVGFLPASGSTATISWTNAGAADGTILLVKSGSAVDANPADWNGYAADLAFGDGDEIGTGNFVVVAGAGKHGSATITGLSAGTTYHAAVYPYNGSASFLNYRTASPGTASVVILPDPSVATATADGKTLIDLAWTKHASYDVMIVYKAGSASTAPTQGASYGVGDACGGGTVIYKAGGSALEHVVASGTTHHYAFYSYSGNYYSAGLADSEATSSFVAGEVVETFSYTNGTALTGRNGETGWGGPWYGDAALYTNSNGSFSTQTNYPATSGNKIWTYPPSDSSAAVFRPLGQTYTSGRLYFGYAMNYTWNGDNKYSGLAFFWSNTAEKVFFGEVYGADQRLGISTNTTSSYGLTAGGGNDYAIVGYYDWSAEKAYVKAYKIGSQAVPVDEPTAWDLTNTIAGATVGWIDTVRLAAGAGAGYGTPGNVYFDEVRIATNWAGIVLVAPSKPEWPTNQAATADGSEMVRLAWTKNGAGNDVMVVHKTGAITTEPTDGTGYSAGNTIDGGTVIYKGSATALEHVVQPGTTNFYKFYSANAANYYSTGGVAAATNAAYAAYEKVNPFSYTNATALGSSALGGQGFGANFWTVDSGTWTMQTNYPTAVVDDVPKFLDMDGYPDMAGNRVYCSITSDGGVAKAQRSLDAAISSGQFYVAFMMSYQFRGANKWAGLSLLNAAGTEKAFLGKGAGANYSTLGIGDGTATYWSAYDLGQYYSSDTYGNTGNVYLIVGKYDFDTDVFQAKAYRILDGYSFPASEPTWDVSQTMAGIDAIARIQLNAGASGGAGWPGKVFYDEIRYATNWSGLIAVTCPTWAGSNALNSAAWTAPAGSYLGDTENFQFQSFPPGLGQSGSIGFDWARTAAFSSTYPMAWWQNANNNSYWTNQVQMTSAGVVTSRFAAAGSSCSPVYAANPALTVSNLVAPSAATATRDGVNTNSQINLEWVRGVSGVAKDTLVVRQTADSGWTAPVNGATYNPGDSLGSGTVVYRGAGTTTSDTGLAPDTIYYYRFYAENWTYYSVAYDEANAATAAGTQEIAIDGNPADWRGTAATVLDSSASSLQEFIWTDKRGELRVDHADHPNADIQEFRIYADATWVYFLVKLTNVVDDTKPFVAIGVDTRTNSASASMNWLGDDSGTFIGDGYFEGGAAHFPEYQLNVHAAGGGAKIELFAHDGTAWYAPATGGNTNVAISAANDAVELKVARADLNLAGTKVARFTVAALLNTGVWNNDGDGTTHVADNTAAAVDSISIPPWGTPDNAANLSAWLEDLSDADVDFWVDAQFAAGGLTDNSPPAAPVLTSPTNAAAVTASPTLGWQVPADADGKVTGYLLEISTNEQFNGVSGTENGPVDLRVNLYATTTNYAFTTSATQYWWRVRARDTAGELSAATTRFFRVVGKLDTEGPQPTLMYIGTNVAGYLAGDYDAHIAQYGPIQSVLDREIRDTNNVFGFVLRWTDASGVYATNRMRSTDGPPVAGGFAYNIVDTDGRVSPNWDLVEIDTVSGTTNDLWGVDRPFYASNTLATGNADAAMTNYVGAAFNVTNYDPTIEYYLTVSAEDAYSDGGSWWAYGSWPSFTNSSAAEPYYSGWCEDGPNTARNVTTNFLIRIHVTDDDIVAPASSRALGWDNDASLVVSNAAGPLDYVEGTGQDVLYQITDGALIGEPLSFSFNAYDAYYTGVALGTTETYADGGRTLTNSAFVAAYWQTNWANYSAARSLVADTADDGTMMTWHWPSITTQDVTRLWGPDSLDGELGVTNLIQLDLFDADNDRGGDQASVRQNFGRIVLEDDDSVDPTVVPETLSVAGTGLAREYALTNLVEWTFPSGADDGTPAPTAEATDIAASDVSHGPSGALQGSTNVYMNAQFYKPASNRWLTFTIEATGGKTFKATSISFDSRVNTLNGPDLVEVFGTMPSGSPTLWASNAIDLSDSENPIGTNWNSYSTSLAMPHATNSAVTFTLQARVADTNHLVSNENANWYVDNLIVSGYVLGPAGGAQITDQDLAYGTATFSLQASDVYSGIDGTIGATGRAPRVDFWNESQAVVPITNAFVTNGWAAATNAPLTLTGAAPAAADKKQVSLGGSASLQYYARFTATDGDVDRDGDWRSVAYVTTNTVYDEDSSRPARGYLYGGPLGVYVDGALTKAVGSGNNREYRINDEQLQTASATSIAVKVNLYDFSGWTVPTLGFSNSVAGAMSTNGWLTSVHTDDVNTTNLPDAAMEWRLSQAQANTLFGSYESVTNEFRVASVWDKDDDRLDAGDNNVDRLELSAARVGYLTFLDNDVGQANVQSNYSSSRASWTVPNVYLGLPGAATRSNLYLSGLPADTGQSAVLAELTNRVYDSQLAKVSAAAPLSVVLPLFDTGGGGGGRTVKGVQRGTALTQESANGGYNVTNSSLTIGSVQTANATNFRSDLSSSLALTKIAAQFPTSTWAFTSFSYADVGAWLPAAEALSNHVMAATLYDADDNRANDQKVRSAVALGTLQVVDNDTVAPLAPTNVKVNGQAFSGWTRDTAAWTNQPTFRVSFSNSVDGAPSGTDLETTGIGEYRTARSTADIGPDLGTPLAVPADGALANYGFESGSTNWTLSGAAVSTEQAYEGTHSVKMTGSSARQTVSLSNTNGDAPRVAVLGAQFMGAATVTGEVAIVGLDANGDPVGGAAFAVTINGAAGQWTGAAATSNVLATAVDRVQVTLTSGTGTYWDDVRVQIELLDAGVPVNEVHAVFTATEQGLVTNYLFAVDRDNNRPGDRKASSAPADAWIPAFGTAYDVTAPTLVPVSAAATENVDDPTTQFDVSWNPANVGPDRLDDVNHPDWPSASDRDLLSPWRSYKIYYGTFDPLNVPGGDPGPGNGGAYIYTNFIATGEYTNWLSVSSTNAISDPSAAGTNYLALTNRTQGGIRLYDLDYDQDYAIVVVGLDKAGNEGEASPASWATNNTIKFAVTQGAIRARAQIEAAFPTNNNLRAGDKGAGALYWIAATNAGAQVTKEYDLIYRDAHSFSERPTNVWGRINTVQSNWFADAPGLDQGLGSDRGRMRFYRASYKDRWRTTNVVTGLPQRPLASEEVYALHNVIVSEGQNHVGLHGEPYTNTFAGVFGTDTNLWPAGASAAAGATKIEFYGPGTNEQAMVSAVYFFGSDANWYSESPLTQVTAVPQAAGFFTRAFSITLPTNLVARGFNDTNVFAYSDYTKTNRIPALVWHPILRVPTNGFSQTIACGRARLSPADPAIPMYNVVALNLPVSAGPGQLNFPTNFTKGTPGTADHIYTIDTATKDPRDGKIIYRADDNLWLFLDGSAVPTNYFKPNDLLVIVSRNGGTNHTWNWTYHPTNFYALPTRWMGQ